MTVCNIMYVHNSYEVKEQLSQNENWWTFDTREERESTGRGCYSEWKCRFAYDLGNHSPDLA